MKMNLKVYGMRRTLVSRGRIQDLPEGMQKVHEENCIKIAGFPRLVLERAPPENFFWRFTTAMAHKNFL
jgi:hypothetical protein